jgi:hypothetical protein
MKHRFRLRGKVDPASLVREKWWNLFSWERRLQALLVLGFLIILMLGISGCTERFKEHQRRQTPALRPPVEAYARLVLLRETQKMLISRHEYQWLGYRFNLGVCHSGTIADIPKKEWRETITSACSELEKIQITYPHSCANAASAGCPIAENASLRLGRVKKELDAAAASFSSEESTGEWIPSTD